MPGDAPLEQLLRHLGEIADLVHAAGLLEWDLQVMMPPGGGPARAHQIGTLRGLAHARLLDPELGRLIEANAAVEASEPPESFAASVVRVARRDHERACRIPVELAAETSRAASDGIGIWQAARANDDYASFRPALDRMLDLKRRTIECFAPYEDPYDVLVDAFEPGLRAETIASVFDGLLPELRRIVAEAPPAVDEPFERGPYGVEPQRALSAEVARAFGVDDVSFRLDPTVHPFCLSLHANDVRLTTRYGALLEEHSLFSVMHEAGHGLYEHGIDPRFARTPLASGASTALHESQSRLWENVIGRSRQFWEWFYPRMQGAHPDLLGSVSLERFHRSIVRPRPSFIRVSADEVTYGLHVILRFELERALLDGSLSTADLPDAWNTRFAELLGITPPNDALGCLQDVHWAEGTFGYFPSYQLGNVLSVQIWNRLLDDLPDALDQVGRGDFTGIQGWLQRNLYALGRQFTPEETMRRIGCGPLDPVPYVAYLQDRTAS